MNRIFDKEYIDDLISKENEIIKNDLDVIKDLKSVASTSYNDATRVPAEAYKGDILGSSLNLKNNIDNQSYEDTQKKLKKIETQLKLIAAADKSFKESIDTITQNTNKIKKIIGELNEFIQNTPLDMNSFVYQFELNCKMASWTKTLNSVDEEVEAIKNRAKGIEQFSTDFSGDPVNLSTGNFVYKWTDLSYGGEGRFCFKRIYNSVNNYEGILGKDWISNFEVKLEFKESKVFDKKEIVVFKEDGKEEIFLPVGEDGYTPESNSSAMILVCENGYEYKTLDGRKYIFDHSGCYTRYEDKNGHGFNLEYIDQTIKKGDKDENRRVLSVVKKDSGEQCH